MILDTTLIDCILNQWSKSTSDFTEAHNHPVFQQLLAHAEDFQKREIGAERFRKCDEFIQTWLKQGDCEIGEDDWAAYYTLWGPEKLAYRLGEYVCLLRNGL